MTVATKPPEAVLVKYIINTDASQKLEQAGILRVRIDRDNLEAEHVAAAEAAGVDPYAARPDAKIADAGTRVFGANGLNNIRADIQAGLKSAGYQLVDIHILPHRSKEKDIVTEVFVSGELATGWPFVAPSVAGSSRLSGIETSTWQFVHVWANPRGCDGYLIRILQDAGIKVPEDGLVVHTVNCVGRQSTKPTTTLEFQYGEWTTR